MIWLLGLHCKHSADRLSELCDDVSKSLKAPDGKIATCIDSQRAVEQRAKTSPVEKQINAR